MENLLWLYKESSSLTHRAFKRNIPQGIYSPSSYQIHTSPLPGTPVADKGGAFSSRPVTVFDLKKLFNLKNELK